MLHLNNYIRLVQASFLLILLISIPSFAQDPEEIPCSEDPSCEVVDGITVINDYTGPDDGYVYDPTGGGWNDVVDGDLPDPFTGGGSSDPVDEPQNCLQVIEENISATRCWANVTGGTIAAVAAIGSGSCYTCLVSLNPVACASCAVLTGISSILFYQAVESCRPSAELLACIRKP